jgi:hypothetical protein
MMMPMGNDSRRPRPVSARRRGVRAAWLAIAAVAVTTALGCDSEPTHPDTGVGAGETPPGTVNCVDLCLRSAACAGPLCNEDTMSTRYTALSDLLASQCATVCAGVQIPATQTQWQCFFQSSCRQVFEHDVCGVGANYSCS